MGKESGSATTTTTPNTKPKNKKKGDRGEAVLLTPDIDQLSGAEARTAVLQRFVKDDEFHLSREMQLKLWQASHHDEMSEDGHGVGPTVHTDSNRVQKEGAATGMAEDTGVVGGRKILCATCLDEEGWCSRTINKLWWVWRRPVACLFFPPLECVCVYY